MNQQTLNDIAVIQEENKKALEFLNLPKNKDKQFTTSTNCVHYGDVEPKRISNEEFQKFMNDWRNSLGLS